MKDFMEKELNIREVRLACYVAPGKGTPVHTKRASHGMAMHIGNRACYVFDDGKKVYVGLNDIIYLPKGSSYTVLQADTTECFAINFEFFEPDIFEPFSFHTKNSRAFLLHFKQAESIWRGKKFAYELRCKIELYNLLYQARCEYEIGYISRSKMDVIQPAIDYIHEKYTTDAISVSYLAELCGVSETYFRKLFLKSRGTSPSKYINDLRITRAKELLQTDLYSVGEISEMSGFKDECYFSRTFKKKVGVSPTGYKEEENNIKI